MFQSSTWTSSHASTEEKLASQIDTGNLKAFPSLLEAGFLGHQFVDLTGQQAPPSADSAGHEVAQQDRQDFCLGEGISCVESTGSSVLASSCPKLMIR